MVFDTSVFKWIKIFTVGHRHTHSDTQPLPVCVCVCVGKVCLFDLAVFDWLLNMHDANITSMLFLNMSLTCVIHDCDVCTFGTGSCVLLRDVVLSSFLILSVASTCKNTMQIIGIRSGPRTRSFWTTWSWHVAVATTKRFGLYKVWN